MSATYPGADAATVESTVTQVIEQQLTGIDNLLYFTSTSASDGSAQITLTFQNGSNPDIAAVQTQNRVTLAQPRLPVEVTQQGIRISKSSSGILGAVALRSSPGGPDQAELNNIVASRILDQIQRIAGVASATQFGAEYGMRIWLDPDKLRGYNMSAAAVLDTVRKQNVQFAAGSIGTQPAIPGQQVSATVTTEGRFTSPEQFENILLRTDPNGTAVRLKDVARVVLGPVAVWSGRPHRGQANRRLHHPAAAERQRPGRHEGRQGENDSTAAQLPTRRDAGSYPSTRPPSFGSPSTKSSSH